MKIKKNAFSCLLFVISLFLTTGSSAGSSVNLLPSKNGSVAIDPLLLAQRKNLPLPKDADGKKNIFLFIDQSIQGRIVEMQIPDGYLALSDKPEDRYMTSLGFSMLLPDLISMTDAKAMAKLSKHKNAILDEQIDIQIEMNRIKNLTYSTSKILAEMFYAKQETPWINFKEIDPLPGFEQGIRKNNTKKNKKSEDHQSTEDFYIDWEVRQEPSKFMTCWPDKKRPVCHLERYDLVRRKAYSVSINFHYQYLSKLAEILRAVDQKIDTFFVKVHPANLRES